MAETEPLERDLELLGRVFSFPPSPPLAAAVRRRIGEAAAPAPPPSWALAAVAAAAALVLVAFVVGVAGPAREAVADLFDRIRIFRAEEAPELTTTPLPTEISGTPIALADAEQRLGFPLKLPSYPEGIEQSLTRVLYQEFPPSQVKAAALFFESPGGPSFVLFETNAVVGKGLIGPGAISEPVAGLGGEAYWLEGLRVVQYYDERERFVRESLRATDANTLVWDEGGIVFRLEGGLSQEEAVKIARSLR